MAQLPPEVEHVVIASHTCVMGTGLDLLWETYSSCFRQDGVVPSLRMGCFVMARWCQLLLLFTIC